MRTALRHASRFILILRAAAVLLATTGVTPALGEELAPFHAPTAIAADATWEGRIRVNATLTVPAGITLTLRPGASVIFTSEAGLMVLGVLRAEGTAEQPVTFSAAGDGAWAGIVLSSGGPPSLLKRCRILAARALVISAGEHVVEQCEIAAGTIGVEVTGENARPVLRANRLHEMREGGIRCLGKSAPLVEKNTIERCGSFGVHASQSAVPLVQGNTIADCASGIELIQTAPYIRGNSVRGCERGIALSSAGGGRPVQGNSVEACGAGIFVQQFSNPELAENTVAGNKEGIVCFMRAQPLIRNNAIRGNETGISCNQIAMPTIEANAIEDNKRGVFLTLSSYAVLRGNNLEGNGVQVELGNMSRDWERRVGKKPLRGMQQQARARSERGLVAPGAASAGDGFEVAGDAVEAAGNWWGEATTREMEEKGPDADIGGLRDWHDVPTLTYEGYEGEYVQDRIRYAPWAKARIPTAGIPVAVAPAGAADSR